MITRKAVEKADLEYLVQMLDRLLELILVPESNPQHIMRLQPNIGWPIGLSLQQHGSDNLA